MTARVTEVSSSSVRAEWSITVMRRAEYLGDSIELPSVNDVPDDIRAALQQWLKSSEGLEGCWFYQTGDPDLCRNCGRPYKAHV